MRWSFIYWEELDDHFGPAGCLFPLEYPTGLEKVHSFCHRQWLLPVQGLNFWDFNSAPDLYKNDGCDCNLPTLLGDSDIPLHWQLADSHIMQTTPAPTDDRYFSVEMGAPPDKSAMGAMPHIWTHQLSRTGNSLWLWLLPIPSEDKSISILTDITTALSYINKQGAPCPESYVNWHWDLGRMYPDGHLPLCHPGTRGGAVIHEWELDQHYLQVVFNKWEQPEWDVFATRWNTKYFVYAPNREWTCFQWGE